MPAYLVGALTRADRPGVLAAFTKALLRLAGNLGECRAIRLRDMNAVLLVVSLPDQVEADTLKGALTRAVTGLDVMRLWIEPLERTAARASGRTYAVTATGPDRPGIIHEFTSALADLGLPLLDLFSQPLRTEDGDGRTFVGLSITVALPEGLNPDDLRAALGTIANDYDLDLSIDESRSFV
jgi:glycine cleavage system regulatory protein